MGSTEAGPPANQSGPPEVPSGVADEAALLAAFADVPTISGVHVQELKKGGSSSSGGRQDAWITQSIGSSAQNGKDKKETYMKERKGSVVQPVAGPQRKAGQISAHGVSSPTCSHQLRHGGAEQ
eukprot:784756-Pelagomonas_calceolata.AAC.1